LVDCGHIDLIRVAATKKKLAEQAIWACPD